MKRARIARNKRTQRIGEWNVPMTKKPNVSRTYLWCVHLFLGRERKIDSAFSRRSEMERRQSGARLIFYRANRAQLSLRFPREPVESKSRSARSGPEVASASINILTYTTWNSRLIYCRYLDALVFGPPGADIICLKKCARQRGPPTTVLPIPPRIRAAPLTIALSLPSLFSFSFSLLSLSYSRHHRRFRRPLARLSSSSLPPPRFTRRLLRSRWDRLTTGQKHARVPV